METARARVSQFQHYVAPRLVLHRELVLGHVRLVDVVFQAVQ